MRVVARVAVALVAATHAAHALTTLTLLDALNTTLADMQVSPTADKACTHAAEMFIPYSLAVECLQSVPMLEEIQALTVKYVSQMLEGVYSYADLILDTSKAPGEAVSGPFAGRWTKHEQAVGWVAELLRINSTAYTRLFDFESDISR